MQLHAATCSYTQRARRHLRMGCLHLAGEGLDRVDEKSAPGAVRSNRPHLRSDFSGRWFPWRAPFQGREEPVEEEPPVEEKPPVEEETFIGPRRTLLASRGELPKHPWGPGLRGRRALFSTDIHPTIEATTDRLMDRGVCSYTCGTCCTHCPLRHA